MRFGMLEPASPCFAILPHPFHRLRSNHAPTREGPVHDQQGTGSGPRSPTAFRAARGWPGRGTRLSAGHRRPLRLERGRRTGVFRLRADRGHPHCWFARRTDAGPARLVGLRHFPLGRRGDPAHVTDLSPAAGLRLVHTGDRTARAVPAAFVLPGGGRGVFLCGSADPGPRCHRSSPPDHGRDSRTDCHGHGCGRVPPVRDGHRLLHPDRPSSGGTDGGGVPRARPPCPHWGGISLR